MSADIMNIKSKKRILDLMPLVDEASDDVCSKYAYETPVLQVFGDVRDVTLGPTPGLGESGCECVFRVGAGGVACPVDCDTGMPI